MKFSTMKQGYNRYEVDTYVSSLEMQVKELEFKLNLYKTKTEELAQSKARVNENYEELKQTLLLKEKANEDLSKLAIREANAVIETANKNAEFIIQEAFTTARIVLTEVSRLGGATNELKQQLKDRINKLNALVENMRDFPTIEEGE